MAEMGKLLVLVGAVVAVTGLALVLGGRFGLGRLPGDLSFAVGSGRVYLPLATSLALSVVLTLLLNLVLRR